MARASSVIDRLKNLVGMGSHASPATPTDDRPKPGFVGAVKEIAGEFGKDDGMTQAAALAFYTGLSIAPMLSIAVWLTQIAMRSLNVGDAASATRQIQAVATQVIGSAAAAPLAQLLDPASDAAKKGSPSPAFSRSCSSRSAPAACSGSFNHRSTSCGA